MNTTDLYQQAQVEVTVKGTSPLLMHRFPLEPIDGLHKMPKEKQAEVYTYRSEHNGMLYIPAVNIQRGLISAATYSKGKGRASLQKVAAACMFVHPEEVTLGVKDYIVDSRSAVNAAIKGRIIVHRPRLDEWEFTCTTEYDPTLLTALEVRKIWDDLGRRVGLLSFRPENKGSYGRFIVTGWKE